VFIDPVGTGYSATLSNSEEDNKSIGACSGCRFALQFIAHYLTKAGRLTSPHYIVGESYGGFRGPKICPSSADADGVGVAGMILLSPALDFSFSTDVAVAAARHGAPALDGGDRARRQGAGDPGTC